MMMLVWTALFYLVFTTVATKKAVLSLDPPWATIFKGDMVTLTCHVPEEEIHNCFWYKYGQYFDGPVIQVIQKAKEGHSGEYACKALGSQTSDPVKLTVSNGYAILQVPYSAVFEGDELSLNCLGWRTYTVEKVTYYKNSMSIKSFNNQQMLILQNVQRSDSGTYVCNVELQKQILPYNYHSNYVPIEVHELFPPPQLKVTPLQWPVEGQRMSMVCYTKLTPQKFNAELEFFFYKDRNIVKRSRTPDFDIAAVDLEDSGQYKCTVQTVTHSVSKESSVLWINVQRLPVSGVSLKASSNDGNVIEGKRMELTCSVTVGREPFRFSWCKQDTQSCSTKITSFSKQATFVVESVTESDRGEYYCLASNDATTTPIKSSSVKIAVKLPVSGASLHVDKIGSEVLVGENLTFTCSVELGSSPDFHWLHNEKDADVASGMYQLIAPGNVLHIESLQPDHDGSYQCLARNQLNQNKIFNSTSNMLTIKALEVSSSHHTLTATFTSLAIIMALVATVIVIFLYFKRRKKTDDIYLNAPASNQRIPEQPAPRRRRESFLAEKALQYDNVPAPASATSDSRTDNALVYAVIDTKAKRNAQTAAQQETKEYVVTYATVKTESEDTGAGYSDSVRGEAHESSDEVYQNFIHQ